MVNSERIDEFHDIWVFCEQREGVLQNTDFELLSEGRKLANERGCQLVGLLLGDHVRHLANQLGGYGADKVIVCESPLLKDYTSDGYADVVCDVVEAKKPEVLLLGATTIGRDLAPRCAARLHTGLTADCTHLDIDMDNYVNFLKESSTMDLSTKKFDMSDTNLKMTRPAFGGHLMATIICPRFRPCMSTVRPGVMKKSAFDSGKANAVIVEDYPVKLTKLATRVLEVVHEDKKVADITAADVIVAVGSGIHSNVPKGLELAQQLADLLGNGVVAGSRPAVESGWLDPSLQVGQTGKTVHPKIYVALGISGAIQHKAGMQDSDLIIAINQDPAAPIFEVADYGIVGNLFDIVPELIEEIKKRQAA